MSHHWRAEFWAEPGPPSERMSRDARVLPLLPSPAEQALSFVVPSSVFRAGFREGRTVLSPRELSSPWGETAERTYIFIAVGSVAGILGVCPASFLLHPLTAHCRGFLSHRDKTPGFSLNQSNFLGSPCDPSILRLFFSLGRTLISWPRSEPGLTLLQYCPEHCTVLFSFVKWVFLLTSFF